MKERGYLLIEMLIALAIISIFVGIVASIQAIIAQQHGNTQRYAQAVDYAHHAIALLQQKKVVPKQKKGFTISTTSKRIQRDIPFILHEATVSFKTACGIEKKVSLVGGMLDEVA